MSVIMVNALKKVSHLKVVNHFCCGALQNFSIAINHLYPVQPTTVTHPHLMNENEVTPGLVASIFHSRRHNIMNEIFNKSLTVSKENVSNLVMIPSNTTVYMSENIPYQFRQNTDFLYLSGFKEINCVLVLCATTLTKYESIMFLPKGSAHSDRWEGKRMDLQTAKDFLKVDRTHYIDDLQSVLQSFVASNKKMTVWYDQLNAHSSLIHQIIQELITTSNTKISVESPRAFLHKLRLIKCDSEVKLMRKVCKITAESMQEVIKFSRPFVLESHLHAKMDYECRIKGADYLAFPPVVAGGDRANTIHYIANNRVICDGEMVLMDAGCEYNGYSSDMARTWPVNGKFSAPQKDIYALVLKVQEKIIKLCATKPPLNKLFKIMCYHTGKELQKLGIISSSATDEELAQEAYQFCPHHVSHYLGMDVHDTNLISCNINLQPGMVITIEPGIYISSHNEKVPPEYRGICVRIEDDILITDESYEILTSDCTKNIEEIENICVS